MPRQTSEGNLYSSCKRRHHHKPNQVTPSPARGVASEATTTYSHRSTSSARKQLFYDTPSAKKGSCSEVDDVNTSTYRIQKNLLINRSNKRGRTSSSSISSSASVASERWDVNSISSLAAVSAGGSVKKSVTRLNSSKKKGRHHRISPTPGTYRFRQQRFSSMDSLASCSSVANKKKKKLIKSTTSNTSSTTKESRRGRLKKKPIRHKHTIVSKHPKKGTTAAAAAAASNISTATNAATNAATNFNGLIPEDLRELIRPPGTPRKLRSPKEILQECEINSRPPSRESSKPRSCKTKQNINYNDERYDQNEFTDIIPIKEIQISPRTAAQAWPNTPLGQRNRNSLRSTIQDSSSNSSSSNSSSNNNKHREIGTTDERTMVATAAASTAQSLLPRRSPRSRSEQTAPATAATTAPSLPRRTARNHSSSQLAVKQHSLLVSPSNSKVNSKQQQEQTMETPVPRLKLRARNALTDLEVQPEFPSTISNQQQSRLLSSGSPLLPLSPHQDSNSYREKQSNHFFPHEDHHTTISTEQQQPQQTLLLQRSGKDGNDRGQTNTQQKEKDPEAPIGTISIPRSPRIQSTSQHIGQEEEDDVVEKRQAGVYKATTARAGATSGAAHSASRNEVTRLKDPPLASVIEAVPDAVRTRNLTKTIEQATQSTQPASAVTRTSETAEISLAAAKKAAPAPGTKKKPSKKVRKTSKTFLLPSPSQHKSALKKATKTALKKKATKKKKKKSKVRFAELPMTTTTYSIKVRVSTSSNSIESKRKKRKKKRHQVADVATVNPLSHSEAHSIANQITQACIAQGRANNNNCVAECDDSSSDEATSSDESSDEESVVDNSANTDGGGVVHNDELVAKNNDETSNSIQGKTQEQIKDGQAENESGTEPSARNNRTTILEEAAQDERRTPIEEDQDKGDGDGNEGYVSDGRSVTSELSMSTTQQGSSRTNDTDSYMHEGEMATRVIEASEEPVAVVRKAKTLEHEEASPAAAAFEGNRSAHCLLENQNDDKIIGGQQQMQDSTVGRADTATDRGCEMHNSQKEQRRSSIWHQSKRLRGGDSLAGSVSDSFRMSTKRARKDAASVCSSIRSKNRKGFSSTGSDAGSSRTSSKKAKKDAGSVCSSIRRKSRILACTESLASSLREEYGSQAGIADSLAPKIPMEVTVRERSEESVSQVKTASDASSKDTSSSPMTASKPTSASYSFLINSSHEVEVDEIVDDANCSMGSSPKSLMTEKSPRRPVRNEQDSRSIDSDNTSLELGLTSLHASKMSEERLPSRAARYWIRKFEEKKARMKAAEKLKRIATVPVVTPTRKTGRRGRPPKSQKKKSPLHDMELPIPVGGSMESFRQSRKALRQLMYYDEADQDWL